MRRAQSASRISLLLQLRLEAGFSSRDVGDDFACFFSVMEIRSDYAIGAFERSDVSLDQADSLAIQRSGVKFLYNNASKIGLKH
jgi:hypothetical protein